VIVHVKGVHGCAVQHAQAPELGRSLVEVIDVGQDAGLRVAALNGDERRFAEPIQTAREAPQLDLRRDADLIADFEQGPITLGGAEGMDRLLRGPGWRRGDARAADLPYHVHVTPGTFQALPALAFVI